MSPAPNVLWIMSDQHNADCLGIAGHPDVKTPHLDSLAREGVRFTRAFCNSPICGPSRACFLSGQHVHTHGISGNDIQAYDRTSPPNLAAHFRAHGYRTAMIGKAHLPAAWVRAGFEHLRLCDLADADRDDPRTCHHFQYLIDQGLADTYEYGNLPPEHPGAGVAGFVSALPFEHSLEAWTGRETLAFLKQRDPRPFFIQMSFQRPHEPYSPAAESLALYDPSRLSLPESSVDYFERRFEGKPAFQQRHVRSGPGGYPYRSRDAADLRLQMAYHFALISVIDAQIGAVIEHLRQTGQLDNTIIVYHADHGDFAGQHGLMRKNLGIYESIHRIPFILRYPGGPRGETRADMIESVDFFPTLCQLAGLSTPAGVEGRSLAGAPSPLEAVVCEWDFNGPAQATVFAVRTPEHRLVYYLSDPDDGELYDRRLDPHELHNLYRDPACVGVRLQLTQRLLSHVGRFARNWSWADDARAHQADASPGPTKLIHRMRHRWSQVQAMFPALADAQPRAASPARTSPSSAGG